MVIFLLCLTSCIAGLLAGWFLREMRDLLKAVLEVNKQLHYHQSKVARAAIIKGGSVFSQGQPAPENAPVVELEDYKPDEPPKKRGGVLRSLTPQQIADRKEKAHKDEMAGHE